MSLLTNDMEMSSEVIIAIYHQRWEIELLLNQPYLTKEAYFFKKKSPQRLFMGIADRCSMLF